MDMREKMINEAMTRMYMLGLPPHIVYNFMHFDIKALSHGGKLEDLSDEYQILIDLFESQTESIVYHAILDEFKGKRFLYLLYIEPSTWDSLWDLEITHKLISNPNIFKERYPVLMAQRIDICDDVIKVIDEPLAIKVTPKFNGGLKYEGLTQIGKDCLRFAS